MAKTPARFKAEVVEAAVAVIANPENLAAFARLGVEVDVYTGRAQPSVERVIEIPDGR